MRRVLILAAFLAVFLGIFLVVAFRRQAPVIPGDELHRPVPRNGMACMSCHGPGEEAPRGTNHPFGTDCWRCHFEPGERG